MCGVALCLLAATTLEVPFIAQEKDSCGAASLAMVLGYWGLNISQGEIARELLQPELHGIAGSHLERFAQDRGLRAVAYRGDVAQLRDFLAKGRPLIVAWRLGRKAFHNVVVTGFDEARQEVLVNDPARGARRRVPVLTFERRWAGAGFWTLLVLGGTP